MPNHLNTDKTIGIKSHGLPINLDNPQNLPAQPLVGLLAGAANVPGKFTVGSQADGLATVPDEQKTGLLDMPVEILLKITSNLNLRTSCKVFEILVGANRRDIQPELQYIKSMLDLIGAIKTFSDFVRVKEQILTERNKLYLSRLYQLITPRLITVETISDFSSALQFMGGLSHEFARQEMFELVIGRFFRIDCPLMELIQNPPVSSRLHAEPSSLRPERPNLIFEYFYLKIKFINLAGQYKNIYPELESLIENITSPFSFCLWLQGKVKQEQSCWKTGQRYGIDSRHPMRIELERVVLDVALKEALNGNNCNQIASRYGIITTEGRIQLEKGSAVFYAEMLNTLLPPLNFQEKVYCYKQEFGLEIKQPRQHLNSFKDLSDLKEVQARLSIITKDGIDEIGEVKKKHELFMRLPPDVLAKHVGSKSSR